MNAISFMRQSVLWGGYLMLKKLNLCFKKILTFLVSLCLFFNLTFTGYIYSYADDAASLNPLFIPIASVVTATAIGSGIIANNSQEAIQGVDQLIQNVISNIKSSEIQKSEADSNYVSPFKVINGGQPEKPNNNNKNGKWVALGAGALASNEIWANREAIQSIMSEINNLKGYNKTNFINGIVNVSDTNLLSTSSASGIALQLANLSNSSVKQFDDFIHSSWFTDNGLNPDNCLFSVGVVVTDILNQEPVYPTLYVNVMVKPDNLSKIKLLGNPFKYNTYTNKYGSLSFYYTDTGTPYCQFLDENQVTVKSSYYMVQVDRRTNINDPIKTGLWSSNTENKYYQTNINNQKSYAYSGYKWFTENPWNYTNNVYNVNQTFEVNFPDWLQDSINLLGQQMEMLRLGLTTIQPSWDPTQEQIQSGLSPTNVINQYINNYENPEYIPEDNPNTGDDDNPTVAPPIQEPQPNNDYLGNFLLPESITTKFPFCIPFDVARCLRLFSTSQREAPKWECDLKYGSNTYHVVIDLSIFDDLASFIRPLEYICFLVGLAVGTRSLMRG